MFMTQQDRRFKTARKHHSSLKVNDGHFFARPGFISEWLQQFDMFGHPITLTYKGKNSFRTSWGACVTFCYVLALVWVITGLAF